MRTVTTTSERTRLFKFDWLSILHFVINQWSSRGARHGRYEEQCDHHQAKVCLRKANKTFYESNLERFEKHDSYYHESNNGDWVDGREVQILGPTRKGRQVLHGYQKRPTLIREQLEVDSQRPGACLIDGQQGRLLEGRDNHQEFADSKMNNQAIFRSCRATKLDTGRSKNVIEHNDSGLGKYCQIHFLLHRRMVAVFRIIFLAREWQDQKN